MAKRDYYEVLGLEKSANKEDIKRAYRRMAVRYHPDRNPNDKDAEDRFKEATEAYEILADDRKRQAYDQFGFAGVEGMAGGSAHDFSGVFRDFEDIFGDFSGIFDSLFGGGRRQSGRRSVQRGADLRYDLEVAFTDAVFGTKVEVAYSRNASCDRCEGSGAEPGSGRKTCPTCGGTGQVRRTSGFFSIASTCPTCSGEGYALENPCDQCNGSGMLKKKQRIKVTIPAGIETGKRINIPGQGDAGPNGGQAGDLYVFIHVTPHEFFERHGDDVYCVVPIGVTQAALGTEIEVPTLDGEHTKLKIPSGTQNGKILRIKNKGVPNLHNPSRRGDMHVKIHVEIPSRLSGKAKNLLRELAEIQGEDQQPEPIPLSKLE